MDNHEVHKPESVKPKTRSRVLVLIGVIVALVVLIATGLFMWWTWEPPLFPDVDLIQEMTLISVDGIAEWGWREVDFQNLPKEEMFHGYPILGSVKITDPQDRRAIISSIQRAIDEGNLAAACFWPRHGLRIKTGDSTIDYNICFHCSLYEVHKNSGISTDRGSGTISNSARDHLNTFFEKAGVPMAPEDDELKEIIQKKQQQNAESQPTTEE